jgi:hypothetical protein
LAISVSIVFRLTLPGSERIEARIAVPSSNSPSSSAARSTSASSFARTGSGSRETTRCEQHVLTPAQRRTHDPVDPSGGGRLDLLDPAPGQQTLAHSLGAAFDLGHVVDQPSSQPLGIDNRALPETQCLTDLGPMELARATRPLVERDLGSLHSHLSRHVIHCGIRDLGTTPREPAPLGIEAQQQREAQLRRPTLTSQELELAPDKCPTVDQLVLIRITHHAPEATSTPHSPRRNCRLYLMTRSLPARPPWVQPD